jgi:hypothetical protein
MNCSQFIKEAHRPNAWIGFVELAFGPENPIYFIAALGAGHSDFLTCGAGSVQRRLELHSRKSRNFAPVFHQYGSGESPNERFMLTLSRLRSGMPPLCQMLIFHVNSVVCSGSDVIPYTRWHSSRLRS